MSQLRGQQDCESSQHGIDWLLDYYYYRGPLYSEQMRKKRGIWAFAIDAIFDSELWRKGQDGRLFLVLVYLLLHSKRLDGGCESFYWNAEAGGLCYFTLSL
jgi:hypothetical protein